MLRAYSKFLSAGVAPFLIVAACLILAVFPNLIPPELSGLVLYGPFLIALLGAVVGWWFNRGRAVVVMLLLLVCYWLSLSGQTAFSPEGRAFLRIGTLYLVPLNLLFQGLSKERGVLNPRGIARMLIVGIQFFAILMLAGQPDVGARLFSLLDVSFIDFGHILARVPQPALVIAVISIGVLFFVGHALETGFGIAIAAIFISTMIGADAERYGYLAATGVVLAGVAQEAWRMAFVDDLTGLPGRRALGHAMAELGNQYAVAMLDVDHFKKFNDTYGHDVGDIVLQRVARELARVSGGGKAFRYGGEEFTVIFGARYVEGAPEALDRLREKISGNRISVPQKNKVVSVTASIGVAVQDGTGSDPWEVLKKADQKLYEAKQAGRNRVAV